MSYLNCSYLNLLSYYDKESDTYEVIELDNNTSTILVETEYMTIDIASDKVIYKDDFTMLVNEFSSLPKLVDKNTPGDSYGVSRMVGKIIKRFLLLWRKYTS